MSETVNSTDAVAEAWASIDGKLDLFMECRDEPMKEEELGYFQGYLADAHELIGRLDKMGFSIIPKPNKTT